MHRSGTSVVSRVLKELGLFQGRSLEENHESTFFLRINDELMQRIHCAWDHPTPMRDFFQLEDAAALTARSLRRFVTSLHAIEYLGLGKLLRHRTVFGLPCPWGWKDPRTIFTLPLWLKLFPGAKLVYIRRNGLDVAASLVAREQEKLTRRRKRFSQPKSCWSRRKALAQLGYKGSSRCLTLPGAFSLWEEYVTEAERHLATLPNERHVVGYEELTDNPRECIAALADFAGVQCDDRCIDAAAGIVHAGRSNGMPTSAAHDGFFERAHASEWMRRYDYDGAYVAG
jgi:hypothetical protein